MLSFSEWHEQLEMVASMSQWNEQVKLVNIATRLKGEAYAFYQSCTYTQCASYPLLVEQLSKRFTPVQIQSVQSSLFHDRKQRQGEVVDTFAKELRPLYRKAYPPAQRGSEEVETMGLHPELKGKLVGQEGTFDQLLAKDCVEEAKMHHFGGDSGRRSSARSYGGKVIGEVSPGVLHRDHIPAPRIEDKNQQFLLEPVESLLAEKGVLVKTRLVQVDKEGCSTLLMQNHTAEPIWLEEE